MPAADILIRPVAETDFKAVHDFINGLENTEFETRTLQHIYRQNLANPNIIYLIATSAGEPVGFISCYLQALLHHAGTVAEIQEMFVKNEWRSKGIGHTLVQRVIQMSRERGAVQMEVTSGNQRTDTHRFYLREGFSLSHKKFTRPL